MARAKSESTGMTKAAQAAGLMTSDEEKEAAALAELSDFFDTVEVDGMEDVGGDDIRLAAKLWNMKGLDAQGEEIKRSIFFDTITETYSKTIECVLLVTQKSLRWDEWDNTKEETIIHCSSSDRVTGVMLDGTERQCKGCPDSGWFKKEDGSPYRKCGPVHTVVAIELPSKRPFLIRFKKTSLAPFRKYLMQHHFGARVAADGSRGNYPLFAYRCTISLTMHESGNYALPVFNRGDVLTREELRAMHENAKAYLDMMREVIAHADAVDAKHKTAGEGGSGSGFAGDDFSDDE